MSDKKCIQLCSKSARKQSLSCTKIQCICETFPSLNSHRRRQHAQLMCNKTIEQHHQLHALETQEKHPLENICSKLFELCPKRSQLLCKQSGQHAQWNQTKSSPEEAQRFFSCVNKCAVECRFKLKPQNNTNINENRKQIAQPRSDFARTSPELHSNFAPTLIFGSCKNKRCNHQTTQSWMNIENKTVNTSRNAYTQNEERTWNEFSLTRSLAPSKKWKWYSTWHMTITELSHPTMSLCALRWWSGSQGQTENWNKNRTAPNRNTNGNQHKNTQQHKTRQRTQLCLSVRRRTPSTRGKDGRIYEWWELPIQKHCINSGKSVASQQEN